MNQELRPILTDIKKHVLKYHTPSKFLIIGSNKDAIAYNTDIDIILIINDDVDSVELIRNISSSIKQLIIKYGYYISTYPIKEKYYKKKNTQFIRNIINNGIEF